MIKKAGVLVLLLAVAIFLPQPNANAAAILTLSDGVSTQVVFDGNGDGVLNYNRGLGAWIVNIRVGRPDRLPQESKVGITESNGTFHSGISRGPSEPLFIYRHQISTELRFAQYPSTESVTVHSPGRVP